MNQPGNIIAPPTGGQLQTREAFQYGRFECMMRPAYGSGIVSSFFLFYDGSDFRTNWNEIDFEFLGRNTNSIDTNIINTVNGKTDKNINVRHHVLQKRSEDVMWKMGIEWAPTYIEWKINDIVFRRRSIILPKPMKLMMNIWIGTPGWAGEFHRGLLPQQAQYEYVRYSAYENNQFVFKWQDEFTSIDKNRWHVATHQTEGTRFVPENVLIKDGKLTLLLT